MQTVQPPPVSAEWLPLLRQALADSGRCSWPLRGDSMRPTLPDMCRIEIAAVGQLPRVGDLIVYSAGGSLVAHRLVRKGADQWITQGDGRLFHDPPIRPDQVLGIVAAAYDEQGRRCWPGKHGGAAAWFWVARFYLLWPLRLARSLRLRFPWRPRR